MPLAYKHHLKSDYYVHSWEGLRVPPWTLLTFAPELQCWNLKTTRCAIRHCYLREVDERSSELDPTVNVVRGSEKSPQYTKAKTHTWQHAWNRATSVAKTAEASWWALLLDPVTTLGRHGDGMCLPSGDGSWSEERHRRSSSLAKSLGKARRVITNPQS